MDQNKTKTLDETLGKGALLANFVLGVALGATRTEFKLGEGLLKYGLPALISLPFAGSYLEEKTYKLYDRLFLPKTPVRNESKEHMSTKKEENKTTQTGLKGCLGSVSAIYSTVIAQYTGTLVGYLLSQYIKL